MLAPRGLARFNKVVTNPIQGIYAWLLPPWAVLVHQGRRSGRKYRTPVVAWRRGDRLLVALFYGEDADWVRNVLAAGGAEVQRLGRSSRLVEPRVVDADDPEVVGLARLLGRLPGRVLVARLEPAP